MTGIRKMKVFYWTTTALMITFGLSLFLGVKFTGNDIIIFSSLLAANGGMFFSANFGEHWAQNRK